MSQRLIETCRRTIAVAVLLSSAIGCGSEGHDDVGGSSGSGGAGGQQTEPAQTMMGGRKSTAPSGGASGMSTAASKPMPGAGGKSGAKAEMDAGMDDDDAGKQSSSGMGTSASCAACERKHDDDPNNNCIGRCDGLKGNTDAAGPMPNVSRAMLCHEILDCFHQTKCAGLNFSSSDCYCGEGADATACLVDGTLKPTGPCKDLIEAGAETTNFADVGSRFSLPAYAVGAAESVLETCDALFCDKECL